MNIEGCEQEILPNQVHNESLEYIKTLDGWRAIAVIAVTFSHLKDAVLTKESLLYPIFSWGLNGVDLFFALSGYLIAIRLIFEIKKESRIDLKSFYIKRFFRLMPASWFYLIFISIISYLGYIEVKGIEIFSTLTFWRNYLTLPDQLHSYTIQFWSLSVEEHFYFFLPLFIIFLKKPKRIIYILILLGVTVTLWRKIGTIDRFTEVFPLVKFSMVYTFGRFDALLYGVLLAYIQKYNPSIKDILRKIHPLFIMVAIFLVSYFSIPLKPTLEALLFPLLIFSTISFEKSFLSKFLEIRVIRYIGAISYSFYIWQQFFVYKITKGPTFLESITGEWHSLIFIFIASALSYHFIETPFRKWGYQLLKK